MTHPLSESTISDVTTSDPSVNETDKEMTSRRAALQKSSSRLTLRQVGQAVPLAIRKMSPRSLYKTPVMFLVEVGALFTLIIACTKPTAFAFVVSFWLWLTVFFATLAEAVAEGRGRAQAAALRQTRSQSLAWRLLGTPDETILHSDPQSLDGLAEQVSSETLTRDDIVVVFAGELIPADGDVILGAASVDESAVTGESAPVIRESGGDRSSVTGGTRVLSDAIVVKVTSGAGSSFIDRMIAMVEGAERKKTPNELALSILLNVLTLIFLLVVIALAPTAAFSDAPQTPLVLVALLVCLIPTTIGALLSAIGIAGMDRLVQHNVIAKSGRAVEAAGDVSTLLLDKTGTITVGDRAAAEVVPLGDTSLAELQKACYLSSLADETPEGRSVVTLVEAQMTEPIAESEYLTAVFLPFTAQSRTSGIEIPERRYQIVKGAASEVCRRVSEVNGTVPADTDDAVERINSDGGTALLVAELFEDDPSRSRVMGVIHLKDVVKTGLRERFETLRKMGIRTVMITGDNALTAKAIAEEAGVDDFLAEATPEDKLALIKKEQAKGRLVAMTGDGTNDAPALAQADVGVAMNTGTSAAKEAGNMVDLDSDPTKLIDIVAIGKQLLITRGALTTFSIANDIAKYFAIIPAMFSGAFPGLNTLNIMHLHSAQSAILSAVIFNALIITALIPLAMKGVRYRADNAAALLTRNLTIFGLGGVIAPFIGIKLIDLLLLGVFGF